MDAIDSLAARWPGLAIEARVVDAAPKRVEKLRARLARGEPGAVGAVVADARGLLLQRHDPATGWPADAWAIPGGGVAAGETWEQALARECEEELSLAVVPERPLLALRETFASGPERVEFPFVYWRAALAEPGAAPRPRAGEVVEARFYRSLPAGTFDRAILARLTGIP